MVTSKLLVSEVNWPVVDVEELLPMCRIAHLFADSLWFLVAYRLIAEFAFHLFRQHWYSWPLVPDVTSVEFISGECDFNARCNSFALHELESIYAGRALSESTSFHHPLQLLLVNLVSLIQCLTPVRQVQIGRNDLMYAILEVILDHH